MKPNLLVKIKEKLIKDKWYRIVFLGDSITSTEWVYPNWRGIIEYVLKEELQEIIKEWQTPCWGLRCYNAGYNGATTREMLVFLKEDVMLHKPDLVIFIGTDNDKYQNINPEEHGKNIEKILNRLLDSSIEVVYTTSIAGLNEKVNKNYQKYMKVDKEVVSKTGKRLMFIDLFKNYEKLERRKFFTFISEDGNEDAGIKPGEIDYDHPNQLGNAYIAKIMLKELFNIEFNPELYIQETLKGKKYPGYN